MMRLSCNGCRVLRKGCSDGCVIRPCLQWIRSPDSQANATIFLAKFYGRAGLLNLLSSCPLHLRPSVFRSLLYEACGRILNPVYGSVGMLWSGNWQLCQAAVEAVLEGAPITQMPTASSTDGGVVPPLKTHDIRHVSKTCYRRGVATESRARFKRSGLVRRKPEVELGGRTGVYPPVEVSRQPSRELDRENDSKGSVGSADGSHVSQAELIRAKPEPGAEEDGGLALDLNLSLLTAVPSHSGSSRRTESRSD